MIVNKAAGMMTSFLIDDLVMKQLNREVKKELLNIKRRAQMEKILIFRNRSIFSKVFLVRSVKRENPREKLKLRLQGEEKPTESLLEHIRQKRLQQEGHLPKTCLTHRVYLSLSCLGRQICQN
jgi:hypothetical protein